MKTSETVPVNGLRLRNARTRLRWSQGELSRRSRVSRSYITEIERGVKQPSHRVATILADTLDVTLDELLS